MSVRTIVAKGGGRYEEYTAASGSAISPGHVVSLTAANEVSESGEDGGQTSLMVAAEDVLQGKTVADAFAAGDTVPCYVLKSGDEAYLRFAASANIAIGDKIAIGTSGQVREYASGQTPDESVKAIALQAQNPTTANQLLLVRVV